MRALGAIAALMLLPLAAEGQTLQQRLADAPDISAEKWRDLTAGKTVTYGVNGAVYGREFYRKNSNILDFRLEDGTCITGEWFMQEKVFCYNWEATLLNCFEQKRLDGEIYIIAVENGVETGDIQVVLQIDSTPLFCGPALLSALEPQAAL